MEKVDTEKVDVEAVSGLEAEQGFRQCKLGKNLM